jgi:hypothetical protein
MWPWNKYIFYMKENKPWNITIVHEIEQKEI